MSDKFVKSFRTKARVILLAQVDLLMPLSPDLGRCEHAAFSTHVAEGGLTGAMSTTTGNTRDTCDSTT